MSEEDRFEAGGRAPGRRAASCVAGLLAIACMPDARAAGGAYQVDDSEIGDPGACQVESWAAFADNGERVLATVPACVVGLGRPVELSVQLQRAGATGAAAWQATPAAKMSILSTRDGPVGVALSAGGAFDLTRGAAQAGTAAIPVTWVAAEGVRVNANLGLAHDWAAGRSHALAGMGVDLDLTARLTLIGETYAKLGPDERNPRAQAGLRFAPADDWDLDLIYGRNVAGEAAHWGTVGLNLRFASGR